MNAAVFKAVCPLELGDKVALVAGKSKEPKEAYYLPDGRPVVLKGAVEIHTITDILTMHYLKTAEVVFMYELDGSGNYERLTVKVPVDAYAEELRRRGI